MHSDCQSSTNLLSLAPFLRYIPRQHGELWCVEEIQNGALPGWYASTLINILTFELFLFISSLLIVKLAFILREKNIDAVRRIRLCPQLEPSTTVFHRGSRQNQFRIQAL